MRHRFPIRHAFAAAAILLVLALPGANVAAEPQGADASHFALYAASDAGKQRWPLDPLTLEDMDGAVPLTFAHDWPQVAASADGSTFVTIDTSSGPMNDRIVVRNGVGGPERLAITPLAEVFNPRLSADGSRLVVEPSLTCGPSGCTGRVWYTYDTHSGELVSTIRADVGEPVWPDLLDPAAQRLYYPFYDRPPVQTSTTTPVPGEISHVGPWPLQIAAYDLTTGQEMARITVPDVFAGWWQAESIDQGHMGEVMNPAIALSPDGSRIAVVDAAVETLTLLDAGALEVVETLSITRPESTWRHVLGWLGIIPQTARAKWSEGRSVSATFSADGQHLYVTGHEIELGDTIEEITGHGLGLTRIDVESGEITAEALAGHQADFIIPAPDGRSVYVLHPEQPWWDNNTANPTFVLQRLDAESLAPMAQRSFTDWPQIILVPANPANPAQAGQ